MSVKWKFLVNPNSGLKLCKNRWDKVEPLIKEKGIDYDITYTTSPFEAIDLAVDAVNEGFNKLIVVSGDGVINEVVNGLMKVEEHKRKAVDLGVLPFGTGNDYNTVLGLPWNPEHALQTLFEKTISSPVSIGKMEVVDNDLHKYFINVLDTGISSIVGHAANMGEGSFIKGPKKYTYLALKKLLTVKQTKATIELDDQPAFPINIMMVSIGCGKCVGGGMLCCVDGHPQNDHFNVFITKNVTKLQTLVGIKRIFKGQHKTMKGTLFTQAKKVELKTEKPIPFQFDGEVYIPHSIGTHLKAEIIPKAINILYNIDHPSVQWLPSDKLLSGEIPIIEESQDYTHGKARKWMENN